MKITDINTLDHETVFQKLQQAKLKQSEFFDFRHRLANGENRSVDVYSGPVILNGKTLLHSIIHDVTDRKQMEEALKERTSQLELANQELESFSYSVSHDLRAPLRAIDGYARMILKKHGDKFDEDALNKFNVIRSNSQMMGQLIDDLLALSRLGRKHLSLTLLDMDALVRDVWKEMQDMHPDRNMVLKLNSAPPAAETGRSLNRCISTCFPMQSNSRKTRIPHILKPGVTPRETKSYIMSGTMVPALTCNITINCSMFFSVFIALLISRGPALASQPSSALCTGTEDGYGRKEKWMRGPRSIFRYRHHSHTHKMKRLPE